MYSGRATAGWWRFRALVGSIMSICAGRRERIGRISRRHNYLLPLHLARVDGVGTPGALRARRGALFIPLSFGTPSGERPDSRKWAPRPDVVRQPLLKVHAPPSLPT